MTTQTSRNGVSNSIEPISEPILPKNSAYQTKSQTAVPLVSKYYKHMIHVICFLTVIITTLYYSSYYALKRVESVGPLLTTIAVITQLTVILLLPQNICNVLGLLFFNTFPGEIKLDRTALTEAHANDLNALQHRSTHIPEYNFAGSAKHQPPPSNPSANLPHLCFRVVTRGLYPELVQNNVRKNFLKCIESNLINFSIEVVTDKDIQISSSDQRIKQIVVPSDYRSSTGSLFKARALQYALEPGNSSVKDCDYIVHLDEETILTENVINGITNFALAGKHDFGQGVITYANLEVVNLITTLADSYRVADDMGKLRFTLGALHRPIFGWKGSFVVTRCGAEKNVSFDHGPDGSIAEDCYFSMVAYQKGYTFDFIPGEMFEKSPFTILDLIRQRKRWVQGFWLVAHSCRIPFTTKFFLLMSYYAWLALPLTIISSVIDITLSIPTPFWLQPVGSFSFALTLYMYIFGLVKSLDLKQKPIGPMLIVYLIGQVLTLSINTIVENIAVLLGVFSSKHSFYIVKKDSGANLIPDP